MKWRTSKAGSPCCSPFPALFLFYLFDWSVFFYSRLSFIHSNLLSSRSQTDLQRFVKDQFAFQRIVRRNAWQEGGRQNNGFRDNWSFQERVLSGNGGAGCGGLRDLYGTVLCQMLFVRLLMVQWTQWVWSIRGSGVQCSHTHTVAITQQKKFNQLSSQEWRRKDKNNRLTKTLSPVKESHS